MCCLAREITTVIEVGQRAPDFELTDTEQNTVRLSDFHGKPVVLFFFPMAFTGVCELQLSQHQHRLQDFTDLGAQVLAISADQRAAQKEFASRCGVNGFPILSDARHNVIKAYGVYREAGPVNERATFILGKDGNIVYKFIEAAPGNWQGIDVELEQLRKLQ